MPPETSTLLALGVGAVIVLWLVFSVLKKLFGLALIAGIVGLLAFLWFNPELAADLWSQAQAMLNLQ